MAVVDSGVWTRMGDDQRENQNLQRDLGPIVVSQSLRWMPNSSFELGVHHPWTSLSRTSHLVVIHEVVASQRMMLLSVSDFSS